MEFYFKRKFTFGQEKIEETTPLILLCNIIVINCFHISRDFSLKFWLIINKLKQKVIEFIIKVFYDSFYFQNLFYFIFQFILN